MKYKRILLKLSGEAMGGADGQGLDSDVIKSYAVEIAKAVRAGCQIGIVVGGGNIFRGMNGVKEGFDRVKGDQMGMLATVINGKALGIFIEDEGVKAEVYTPHPMEPFARHFNKDRVMEVLNAGGVAIFTGGTGNPFFTTDSAASLKACEIEADALLKGTKVDGVRHWIHVAVTKFLTYMAIHRKRGAEGTDANGVMPNFRGIAVHDCWKVYFGYLLCQHAVCCAHLLRELKYLMKNLPDRKWCRRFFEFLLYMKKIKERDMAKGLEQVSPYHLKKFQQMYADIIALAHQECPADPLPPKNSIEAKKELPLIKRLESLESSVTLFVRNFDVPFDNNEAERAIRCVRIKTKSAGCFRGSGGEDYCTLMSYINTAWKHGVNAFNLNSSNT